MERIPRASRMLRTSCALLILSITLYGCDAADRITKPGADAVFQSVVDMGFSPTAIKDKGDYFLVEGDIMILKSQLRRTGKISPGIVHVPGGPMFQTTTNNLVNPGRTEYMNVDLSELASLPEWAAAARDAMNQWNSIVGSRLRFTESAGPVHVRFYTYHDQSGDETYTAARATFPSGGNPGSSVNINLGFYTYLPPSAKVFLLVHELGHTVGFRHTNWSNNPCVPGSEGVGSDGANQVSGTPPEDGSSVMNGCTAGQEWNGFSFYDRVASRVRYQGWGPKNQSGWVEGGHPKLSWSPSVDAEAYLVYRNVDSCTEDPEQGYVCQLVSSELIGSTTSTDLVDYGRSAAGTRQCDGSPVPFYYVVSAVFPASGETMRGAEYFNRSACYY